MLSSHLIDTQHSIMQKAQEGKQITNDIPCKRKVLKNLEKMNLKKRSDKGMDEEYIAHDPMKKRAKSKKKNKQKNQVTEQKQQKKQQSASSSSSSSSESSKNQPTQQAKQEKIQEKVAKKSRSKSRKKKSQSRQRSSKSKEKKEPKQRKKAKGYVYKPPKQKPIQKLESINEIMRQYSRISRKKKRKSNFYLDKIDSMKWGEPVGRGAKKKKQKLQEINRRRKEIEKQRKKQEKKARQLRLLNKQVQLNPVKVQQVVLSESQDDVKIQDNDKAVKNKNEFDINKYILEKLIDLYTVKFYDLQVISKGLPQLPLKQIRFNCQVLFQRCLSRIQTEYHKQSHKKTQRLSENQRQAIVSQLFQPKVTNRLVNPQDAQFNQYFNKLLYSIHNPAIVFEEKEIKYLLKKIQEFSHVSLQKDDYDASLKLEVKQE